MTYAEAAAVPNGVLTALPFLRVGAHTIVVRIETRFFRPKEGFLAYVGLDFQSICQD